MGRLAAVMVLAIMVLSGMSLLSPVGAEEPLEVHATTDRVVLVELFTGASCGPCVNVDNGVDDFIDDHTRTEAVALVYHRSIPSADKLETSDSIARHNYYLPSGVGASTPNLWVDGIECAVGNPGSAAAVESWLGAKYTDHTSTKSEFSITVDGIISPSLTGTVWINVTAGAPPTESNLYLYIVIVRKEYGPWNGGNGVQMHHWVPRKILPNSNGAQLDISNGVTVPFTYIFDLSGDHNGDDYWSEKDDMAVVAFVQSHNKTQISSEWAPRERYISPILQASYADMRVIPNKPPWISQGQVVVPEGATEDNDVTFKAFYWDVDDFADRGPTEAKVYFKNDTSDVMQHDLTPVPSANPWTDGKWLSWTTKLDPGTYTYRFAATDGEDDALGDTAWNTTTFTIKPRNKIPQLMAPNYAPLRGDTSTKFRFDIMYRDLDNEEPTSAQVYINGEPHDMTTDSVGGPFNDWVVYYFDTTLSVGDMHKFYYLFSDGIDERRYPAATDSPNWILGPEVEPPNNEPTLTTALFNPSEGTRQTEFTFSIIYTDGENDHPTISYIYVDDVPNIMDPDGSNYVSGVRFTYRTKLDMGSHMYYFIFNDGKNEVRYPAAGAIEGPTVLNMDPEAVIISPTSGVRYTPDDYIPFSAVGSEDPEGDDLTYSWKSSIDGELSTLEAFDKRLSEGMHTITLTVTDEFGGTHSKEVQVDVRPYLPRSYIEGYIASVERPVEKDQVRYTVTINNDGEARQIGLEVRFLVDGAILSTDTVSVDINSPVDVRFTWEAVAGQHTIRFEIVGDSDEYLVTVDANTVPEVTPDIQNPGGLEAKYKVNSEIYFRSNAEDGNDDALEYAWNFGDGSTSSQADPSHIYIQSGEYVVTVKVTDARGGETTQSFTVQITKPKQDDSPGFGVVMASISIALLAAAMVATRRRS